MMKILSGRFILTVVCAFVFAYCAVNKTIPVDATVAILSMVFISYFQRQDRTNGKEQK
jgi:hypothetical protein